MDPLAALFAHVAPSAHCFFAGNLCATADFAAAGHLHLLRAGGLTLCQPGAADLAVAEPSLLFFPRDRPHRLVGVGAGAELVCATVDLGHAAGNPIGQGLPEFVLLPLSSTPGLGPACELLLVEAFGDGGGRQAALDHLFDYLLILVVRAVIAAGDTSPGVLAGLADPRLARALTAMHEQPGRPWTVERLADAAGMSRTRFAAQFRAVVGRPPLDYLTGWRMTLAHQQLAAGKPVKTVAAAMGYDSPAAFSRVFHRQFRHSPRAVPAVR